MESLNENRFAERAASLKRQIKTQQLLTPFLFKLTVGRGRLVLSTDNLTDVKIIKGEANRPSTEIGLFFSSPDSVGFRLTGSDEIFRAKDLINMIEAKKIKPPFSFDLIFGEGSLTLSSGNLAAVNNGAIGVEIKLLLKEVDDCDLQASKDAAGKTIFLTELE